jgi:hypothetical protein
MPKPDDVGPSALQWFLIELDKRPGCPATKEMVRELLRVMAGQRLFLSRDLLGRGERLRIAQALLAAGFTATQARAELAARCKFSRRTADRVVAEALNQRAIAAAVTRQGSQ